MLLFLVLALITALGSCADMWFSGDDSDNPLEDFSDANWNVVSLSIDSLPYKTVYAIGESPDWTVLEVRKTYSDGRIDNLNWNYSGCEISGFDSSNHGVKTITVSINGVSATFTVTVM